MRKIRLEALPPYSYKCEFRIIDVSEGKDKKRGAITVDYGKPEIDQLLEEGRDFDSAMEYYHQRIYSLVKMLIADEWECVNGFEEADEIISGYIKDKF